jgi:predicted RNA-binding Zn-ribbon protein involved in translation (DUF1610 family)
VAKIARTSCESCGDLLEGRPWFSRHLGKGVQRLCPDCTGEVLARLDAEARHQVAELERAWRVPFDSVGEDTAEAA